MPARGAVGRAAHVHSEDLLPEMRGERGFLQCCNKAEPAGPLRITFSSKWGDMCTVTPRPHSRIASPRPGPPLCQDIYFPRSKYQGNIDGAYFGTTFPHLFLMTYGA